MQSLGQSRYFSCPVRSSFGAFFGGLCPHIFFLFFSLGFYQFFSPFPFGGLCPHISIYILFSWGLWVLRTPFLTFDGLVPTGLVPLGEPHFPFSYLPRKVFFRCNLWSSCSFAAFYLLLFCVCAFVCVLCPLTGSLFLCLIP